MPDRFPQSQRDAIAADIRLGLGRNAIARLHGVSTGLVSKIARENKLFFEQCVQTAQATECRSIDAWGPRVEREDKLFREYLALEQLHRTRDGKDTREHRRLSYALYNVNRHAKPRG